MRVAKNTISRFFLAAFSLMILMPQSGRAQDPSNRPTATVDDGKLRSFAKVYVQVEKIRQTYGPQLKETQDPQKGMEIQKEAKSKIDDALAKEGMTVESYSQVVQTMNGNDELRKKAIEMIDQERTKP
jgi:membrane protease subunit (stomatin/prohibitin family)